MNLNDLEVFSLEDRKILRNFFAMEKEFLKTNSLLDKENLKVFEEHFVMFLEENNLEDKEIFKVFLLDLKREELREKLNSKKPSVWDLAKPTANPPFEASSIILRWYEESKVITVLTEADINEINRIIEPKILQNRLERQESWGIGSKVRVK